MKWIVGIVEPLFMREKTTHIGDGFGLRLHDEIMDRLCESVCIGYGQSRSSPLLPSQRVFGHCSVLRFAFFLNVDRAGRLRFDRFHWFRVAQKELSMNIFRKHIARDTDCDRAMVLRKSRFNVLDGTDNHELEAHGPAFFGREGFRCGRIPWLRSFPFVLSEGLTDNHPVVEALKCYSARG